MFDIQKFAGGGNYEEISGPMWYYLTRAGNVYNSWGAAYLPDGTTVTADANESMHWINATAKEELQNGFTIVIDGAYTTDAQTSPSVVELTLVEGKTVGDVVVTGTGASGLTLTISGTAYAVGQNGKLVEVQNAVVETSVISRTQRQDGKVVSKNYTFINPNASDVDIAAAINALNGLTTHATISGGMLRVNKTVIG